MVKGQVHLCNCAANTSAEHPAPGKHCEAVAVTAADKIEGASVRPSEPRSSGSWGGGSWASREEDFLLGQVDARADHITRPAAHRQPGSAVRRQPHVSRASALPLSKPCKLATSSALPARQPTAQPPRWGRGSMQAGGACKQAAVATAAMALAHQASPKGRSVLLPPHRQGAVVLAPRVASVAVAVGLVAAGQGEGGGEGRLAK